MWVVKSACPAVGIGFQLVIGKERMLENASAFYASVPHH